MTYETRARTMPAALTGKDPKTGKPVEPPKEEKKKADFGTVLKGK